MPCINMATLLLSSSNNTQVHFSVYLKKFQFVGKELVEKKYKLKLCDPLQYLRDP